MSSCIARRLAALLTLLPLAAAAQIGISPRILIVDLDHNPRGHSFRLLNLSPADISVEIEVAHFAMDEANRPIVAASTPDSLDQWLIVNPLRFDLPAGQSQTVRLAFRPQQQLAAGEYRAMIYFTEIPPPPPPDEPPKIRSRFRLGAAVYAFTGEERFAADLLASGLTPPPGEAQAGNAGPELWFEIENRGNRHVRLAGQWAIWRRAAYPGAAATQADPALLRPDAVLPAGMLAAGALPTTPVLPGDRRTVRLTLPALAGDETDLIVDLDGHLGEVVLDSVLNVTQVDDAAH